MTGLMPNTKGLKDRNLKYNFKKIIKQNWVMFLMVLPVALFFLVFSYLPMAGIIVAFKNYNYADGIFRSPWSGFRNFRFFFIGGKAFSVTFNTFAYNMAFIITGTITQIGVAVILSEIKSKYFKRFSQFALFLPYFISWVVVSAFMHNIFNYEFGVLNTFLKSIDRELINVNMNIGMWKYILVLANIWKWTGHGSVVYLAAIMGIDHEMHEAAEIDGATIFQRVRFIVIPTLTPQIIILTLLSVGRIFRGNFQMFYQVTGNNPLLHRSTDVIDTFVFRALMDLHDFGMAASVGVYQSVLCLVIISLTNYLVKKYNSDYALF